MGETHSMLIYRRYVPIRDEHRPGLIGLDQVWSQF